MSLKMECYSKWNVNKNGISLKIEFHSKWKVTQNEMSLKTKCYSKLELKKVTQIGTFHKMKCHLNWNVT